MDYKIQELSAKMLATFPCKSHSFRKRVRELFISKGKVCDEVFKKGLK